MLTYMVAYWIAFGPHGPRALPPPGEGTKVFAYTLIGVAVSAAIFGFARYFARAPPPTMNREYQEASDAYLKVCYLLRTEAFAFARSGLCLGCTHNTRA